MRILAALLPLVLHGCAQPECTNPNYRRAECRVVAENDAARLRLASGVELRFQDPAAEHDATWDATGLLQELGPDTVRARVAGPGDFALTVRGADGGPSTLNLVLDNVDPIAAVTAEVQGTVMPVPSLGGGLQRTLSVVLDPATPVWIRGTILCPERYRIAVTSDIQTNPGQFARILEALAEEAEAAEALGEPVRALVLPGDITESSRDDEFDAIEAIIASSPVPVALTPGNHDIYRPFRPLFNARFGPGNYAVSLCTTRLVMLDSGSGAIAPSVEGRLPELLDRRGADHLMLAMHHPPYAALTGAGWSQEDRAQHLLAEAAIADTDLILAGHAHALHDFSEINVGDVKLRELIAGTGGAYQGLGIPRFGYLRLTISPEGIDPCFVEVPPPGFLGHQNSELSARLPYCD